MSDQLLIAGFHRSGTSLTSNLFHRAGLFLGYDLLGANASNPYGHYEDVDMIQFHDRILTDHGLTWRVYKPFIPVIGNKRWRKMEAIVERRNVDHPLWGFKDPRMCLFLMHWKYLLPNAKVLIVYRHFSDCYYSLGRRHAKEYLANEGPTHLHRLFWEIPDLALRMWLVHNLQLIYFAKKYPEDTVVISHKMLTEGFPIVKFVADKWNLPLEPIDTWEVYDPAVTTSFRHKQPVSDVKIADQVIAAWDELEQLSKETFAN